jgi:MMPL family protein
MPISWGKREGPGWHHVEGRQHDHQRPDPAGHPEPAGIRPARCQLPAPAERLELRTSVIPPATRDPGQSSIVAYVGGVTAGNVDLASKISSKLFIVIAVVLALSFLLLLVAFRSLLIPLQAAITNLLCVGAAFGVLTATFQWGWD